MKVVHVLSLSAIGGVQNSFLTYYELATKKSQFEHEICLTRRIGKDYKSLIPLNHYSLRSINGIIKLIYQIVSKNTIVFNNLVVDIEDYNNNWEVPASKSWHSRFF